MRHSLWYARQIILRLFYAAGMLASISFFAYMLFLKITTFSVIISVINILLYTGAIVLFFILLGHLLSWTRPFLPYSDWKHIQKK